MSAVSVTSQGYSVGSIVNEGKAALLILVSGNYFGILSLSILCINFYPKSGALL